MTWSFILWVDGLMYLLSSSVEIWHVSGRTHDIDHRSMKLISLWVAIIWQSSMRKQVAYVERLFKKTRHMDLVGLWQIKAELCKFFF